MYKMCKPPPHFKNDGLVFCGLRKYPYDYTMWFTALTVLEKDN